MNEFPFFINNFSWFQVQIEVTAQREVKAAIQLEVRVVQDVAIVVRLKAEVEVVALLPIAVEVDRQEVIVDQVQNQLISTDKQIPISCFCWFSLIEKF